MDGIENLLVWNNQNFSQEKDFIYNELEKYECSKIIEKLQDHPYVFNRALEIIEKYYRF